MITHLHLRNFQIHRKRTIEFDELVTTIVGPTDVGKSSILRALRWVCLNQGDLKDILTRGQDFVRATLEVDDRRITRKRSKTENLYKLDGKRFKAFGKENVPEEIANLLNLSETNFQQQLDLPFWFVESAGFVSRELNQIVNLGAIDTALANVASRLRKARSVLDVSQERLSEAREKKRELIWVKGMDESLSKLETSEQDLTQLRSREAELRGVIRDVSELKETQSRAIQSHSRARNLVRVAQSALEASERATTLRTMLKQISYARDATERQIPSLDRLDVLKARALEVGEKRLRLGTISLAWFYRADAKKYAAEAERFEERINKLTKGRCPICQRPIKSLP